MKPHALTLLLAFLAAATLTAQTPPPVAGAMDPAPKDAILLADASAHLFADIETSKGTVTAELDFQRAPLTALNFVGLAEGTLPFQGRPAGQPFYDGLTIHRVVPDFVIQGGDPASADPAVPNDKLGDGSPGYQFPDEFSPALRHDATGVLSMSNDGPDTNGCQFFITLRETNRLNYLHSAFGQVVRGLDVVQSIAPGDKILHVRIRREGAAAEAFRADASVFERLKKAALARRHPAAPEGFVYLEDGTHSLPDFRVKNFNYKLANYERATGHRLAVRLAPEFKPQPPDQSVGSAVKTLAAALGLPDTGDNALVGYFAPDQWSVRLGERLYPALFGPDATTDALMTSGAMRQKKTALLAGAQDFAKQGKLKEAVDSAIDTLILALDDAALKTPPDGNK